jgi:hypothetical protein
MSAEIITVYDKIPVHPYLFVDKFHKSLETLGHKATVLGFGQEWRGLMTKPLRMREYLESGACKADYIIQADAFDVVWAKGPDEIVERFKEFECEFVASGEMNCFPEVGMACDFPQVDSPLKFLNSGFIVATPDAMLAMLRSMNVEAKGFDRVENGKRINPSDQYYVQLEYFKQPCHMKIDTEARLALNLCGVPDWTIYDPCAYHFNGDKEPACRADIFKKLGL